MRRPSRAFTDRLTSGLHLLDMPSNAVTKYVLEGKLPIPFLPSFLHEATHHWCQSTDLGGALALLELRVHRDLASHDERAARLLSDVGTLYAAHQILQPLLEGMALFQEFDAFPGRSHVWAAPGLWAARLFRELGEKDIPRDGSFAATLDQAILKTLLRYRSSEAARQRKLSVLMRATSEDSHGYLIGYLTVKRLWQMAAARTPAFGDRDLFLSFLRDWIFQDWELIELALDEEFPLLDRATLLSERLQHRLNEIATQSLSNEATTYDRESDDGRRSPEQMLRALHLDEEDARRAQDALRELVAEIVDNRSGSVHENWVLRDAATLQYRTELIRLAAERVQIEVNEHRRVLVRKLDQVQIAAEPWNVYASGPALDSATSGISEGWMTVHLLLPDLVVMQMVHRDDEPMFSLESGRLAGDRAERLKLIVTAVVPTEDARRKHSELARQLVESLDDPGYQELVDSFPGHVLEVFKRFALNGVSAQRRNTVSAQLDRRGIYEVVGRDGDLLFALVEMSLVPFVDDQYRPFLTRTLRAMDIDLDESLKRLLHHTDNGGLPLLVQNGGLIVAVV